MNLREILIRTAAQTGEDMLGDEERALAVAYVGEAYEEMMAVYRPYIDLWIRVPEDGVVPCAELDETAGRVVKAVVRGIERPFNITEEGVYLAGAGGLDAMIRCKYMPAPLENEDDEAELPRMFAGALADYASYRLMQGGGRARQQRGDAYYSRYLQRRATLAPYSPTYRENVCRKYE